jgi:hypothetical protein
MVCFRVLAYSSFHSYSHSAGPFLYFHALAGFLSFFEVRWYTQTPVCSHACHSGNLLVMHFKRVIAVLPANLKLFVRAPLVSWVTLPCHHI